MFGAGRALMLQLAHEAVAQGVEDHSDFKGNPFKRLLGTLEATYAVVYGSEELARGVGRRIQWIHDFVVGPHLPAPTTRPTCCGCTRPWPTPRCAATSSSSARSRTRTRRPTTRR